MKSNVLSREERRDRKSRLLQTVSRPVLKRVRLDTTAGLVEIQNAIKTHHEELKTRTKAIEDAVNASNLEMKATGVITTETKNKVAELATKGLEVQARLLDLEQKIVAFKPASERKVITPGRAFVEDTAVKAFITQTQRPRGKIHATMNSITSLDSGDGGAGDLIRPDRVPGIIELQFRKLTIRDLLPSGKTTSNSIEFVQETGFTNNAAPVAEGAAKPESSIAFELQTAPVRTIAHWMKASVQILADVPQLQAFIDNRLRIGLGLEEEDQLLAGDGTGQNLYGLIPQATPYDTARSQIGDTRIDTIRRAMTQLRLSQYRATGIVMHPTDWEEIELTKETTGAYVWANPRALAAPTIWGLPVVESDALDPGEFLIGAFNVAAAIHDRQQATVEVSTEDGDNFIKNMVTIRGEERLALTVYRPESFVFGDFDSIVST